MYKVLCSGGAMPTLVGRYCARKRADHNTLCAGHAHGDICRLRYKHYSTCIEFIGCDASPCNCPSSVPPSVSCTPQQLSTAQLGHTTDRLARRRHQERQCILQLMLQAQCDRSGVTASCLVNSLVRLFALVCGSMVTNAPPPGPHSGPGILG